MSSVLFLMASSVSAAPSEPVQAYFQAHRGGLDEVPENTMAAFRHAWTVEGAVPEVDIQTTKDGVMVCMHDDTPARTTDAPAPLCDMRVPELTFAQIEQWDAGIKFASQYAGEKVPQLRALFEEMRGWPERQLYLDLKGVDLAALKALIEEYSLFEQVIFVHATQTGCIEVTKQFPGARTMTWCSGLPPQIKKRFETLAASNFEGISQLQFHLQVIEPGDGITYMLDDAYLKEAFAKMKAAGVEMQLRPFEFDAASLRRLLDMGVRWFVADAPARFASCLRDAYSK